MRQFLFAVVIGIVLSIAVYSQQPGDMGAPPGTILYFDLAACPTGWTAFTTGQGAYIVGLPASGTKSLIVGSALTNQENRDHTHTIAHTHTMAHTHTVSGTTSQTIGGQPAETTSGVTSVSDNHTHSFSVASSASSAANTGSESTANSGGASTVIAPYMQYPLCQKS